MQNDQFGEFISQLPPGPFIMVCGSTLLLMFAIFYIGYLRPRMNKNKAEAASPASADNPFVASPMPTTQNQPVQPMVEAASMPPQPQAIAPQPEQSSDEMALSDDDPFDLPDLNALVDTTGLIDDTPPPPVETVTPEPIPAPTKPEQPVVAETPPAVPSVEPKPSAATSVPPAKLNEGEQIIQLNTGFQVKAEEVVTVLRDARDGRLVVQVDGTGYRSLLDDPEVKKQFVAVMKELSQVVTAPDDNPPEADVVVATAAPTPMQPAPPKQAAVPPIPAAPPPTATPQPQGDAMPGDLPKFDLDDSVTPTQGGLFGTRVKYESQPVPELDIAGSIEAFLQYKLGATGAYPGRQIHVHSAPGGGVRIQVDQTYYEAVSDVADDEVREFLSTTIAEWQERQ